MHHLCARNRSGVRRCLAPWPSLAFAVTLGAASPSGSMVRVHGSVLDPQNVIFKHYTDCKVDSPAAGCTPTRKIGARAGDLFVVTIAETDTVNFTYAIAGVANPTFQSAPQPPATALRARAKYESEPHDMAQLTQVLDPKYAGYQVTVRLKKGAVNRYNLGDMTITITVETNQWNVGFAGGFTVSGLTDPAFAVQDRMIAAESGSVAAHVRPTLVIQKDRQDVASIGPAAFVHVSHSTFARDLGYTFGLGTNTDRGPAYYLGLSWLWGDKGALTGGVTVGQVKSGPSGVNVGDSVASSNVLNSLGTHYVVKLFIGLSYTFIGGAQAALSKQIAGAGQPAPQGTAPAPTYTPNLIGPSKDQCASQKLTDAVTLTVTSSGQTVPAGTVSWNIDPPGAITLDSPPTSLDASGVAKANGTVVTSGKVKVTVTYAPPSGNSVTANTSVNVLAVADPKCKPQ
jgi:hypothetical protein